MSTPRHIVIAGAGQAGFQAAAGLRAGGFQGNITLVGEESGLPYQRPPLSKAYQLHGEDHRLLLRREAFFGQQMIAVKSGRRIEEIDRDVRRLRLDNGEQLAYDHLILALGSRNNRPPIVGAEKENVLSLRTLEDARAIRQQLASSRHLVIIGGGFIGLEVATSARAQGLDVTVLEAADRLMARVVSAPLSEYYLNAHRAAGVKIRTGVSVRRIIGDGARAIGVALGDDEHLGADCVLLATGVRPNVELAEDAGLITDNGIVVDEFLITSDPAISAIGDCATFTPHGDRSRIRLESVQNATDQARCVSDRLLGRAGSYRAVPWFWSDQHGGKLQIAGLTGGADDYQVEHSDDGCRVHCFRGETYLGLESVAAAAEHIAARKVLALQPVPERRTIAAFNYDLRALLAAR